MKTNQQLKQEIDELIDLAVKASQPFSIKAMEQVKVYLIKISKLKKEIEQQSQEENINKFKEQFNSLNKQSKQCLIEWIKQQSII